MYLAQGGAAMKRLLILLVLLVGSVLLFSNPSFSKAGEEVSALTAAEARGSVAAIPPPPELRDGTVTLTEGYETDVYEYYVTYYGAEPIEYFVSKPHPPAVPPDVGAAIDKGLAWLAGQQNTATGAWNLDYYPVGSTAFAVLKFEHHAARLGKDPFASDYIYHAQVEDGWGYIFENGDDIKIDVQTVPGARSDNPDGDGDNRGIYFASEDPDKRSTYETGIVMMALQASGHPDDRNGTGATSYLSATYREIMQDMVDFVSWAQQDTDWGRGGWRYAAFDDGVWKSETGISEGGGADNSASQWPVLGLMAAERWCIFAPEFVTSELLIWLGNSQDNNGGFHYYDKTWMSNDRINVALTASGLIQLTYCGVPSAAPQWDRARTWIGDNWADPVWKNVGNGYAMYGVMKAAVTAIGGAIWFYGDHEWQEEYDAWLLANQTEDGGKCWPGKSAFPYYQQACVHHNKVIATEYALLILQKVAPTWDEMHPRKAVDSNGDPIIVFMSNRYGKWEIFYREQGEGDVLISDRDCIDSVYPAVALDSADNAHVVWADRRDGNWEIYYSKIGRRSGPDDDLTHPDVRISLNDGRNSGWVPVGADDQVITLDDGDSTEYLEHPDITVSSNEVFVVWSDKRSGDWEIYCQKQSKAAIPVPRGPNFIISNPTIGWDSMSPAIDAAPGYIHIVWQKAQRQAVGAGWEILYEKREPGDPTATLTGFDDFAVTIPDPWHSAKPDIAVDDDGCAHIVWMDNRMYDPWHLNPKWGGTQPQPHPGQWEIYTTLIDHNGKFPWQETKWLGYGFSRDKRQSDMNSKSWYGSYTGGPDDHSMYPRIATYGGCDYQEGEKDITWHDLRTGNWEVYHSRIANECNNPETDEQVSLNAEDDMYPDKALDPANKPDITWQKQRPGRWEVLETPYNKDEYVALVIDELYVYDLVQVDPTDTDATDGILYGWSTTLEGGPPPGMVHTYRFQAYADGQEGTGDVGLHDGPIVLEAPVGGVVELPVEGSHSSLRAAEGSGSSAPPYAAIAGAAAAAAVALTAGGWYARRRWLG